MTKKINNSLDDKLKDIKYTHYKKSLLTFIKDTNKETIKVSPDLGSSWEKIPKSEVLDVEFIRYIHTINGTLPLVYLVLKEEHPQTKKIILKNQLKHEEEKSKKSKLSLYQRPVFRCGDICGGQDDFWGCVYWCAFLA